MTSAKQFMGLDAHENTSAIAVPPEGRVSRSTIGAPPPHDVQRLIERITALGRPEDLQVAFEAGPTGYGLYRELTEAGISCLVIAPSNRDSPRHRTPDLQYPFRE